MNEKIASILNPSKAFSKRAFDFGFNWVSLIACNPLLPLHLWITKSPWFWSWTARALPFLQLRRRRRRRVVGVGGAVRPGGGWRPIIRLYLHVGIGVEIWSVIRHGFFFGAFCGKWFFFGVGFYVLWRKSWLDQSNTTSHFILSHFVEYCNFVFQLFLIILF